MKFNKKGQVSEGLSWFVGFIIIFFIMFLFVSASLILAGKKEIPVIGEGRGSIDIEESVGRIVELENLFAFLSSEIEIKDESITVKELAFRVEEGKIKDKELEQEMKNFIQDFNPEAYLFRVQEITTLNTPLQITNLQGCSGKYNNRGLQKNVLEERGSSLPVYQDNNKLTFQLFIGDCP